MVDMLHVHLMLIVQQIWLYKQSLVEAQIGVQKKALFVIKQILHQGVQRPTLPTMTVIIYYHCKDLQ